MWYLFSIKWHSRGLPYCFCVKKLKGRNCYICDHSLSFFKSRSSKEEIDICVITDSQLELIFLVFLSELLLQKTRLGFWVEGDIWECHIGEVVHAFVYKKKMWFKLCELQFDICSMYSCGVFAGQYLLNLYLCILAEFCWTISSQFIPIWCGPGSDSSCLLQIPCQ